MRGRRERQHQDRAERARSRSGRTGGHRARRRVADPGPQPRAAGVGTAAPRPCGDGVVRRDRAHRAGRHRSPAPGHARRPRPQRPVPRHRPHAAGPAQTPQQDLPARHRRPGPRPARPHRLRQPDLPAGRGGVDADLGGVRRGRRRGRGLPRRPGRHGDRAGHRRGALDPVPARGHRHRVDRRAEPHRHDHRDRVLQLVVDRPHRARPGAVDPRTGVRRGGPLARRERLADHVRRRAAQRACPGDRLHDAADPAGDRVRGHAVVPRPRRARAHGDLGWDARRLAPVLPRRLVVPAVPRPRAADHHAGVQHLRRRRARRVRPAHRPALRRRDHYGRRGREVSRFLVRRALRGLLVIWLITLVLFGMFFVAPSNVAQTLGGRQATPETIALINQRLGLDRPLWQQYLSFVGGALRGDLGYDYYKQIPVTSIIADALPKTASIAFGAAVIWMLLGVTNGVLSAVRPRTFVDRGLTAFSLFFYSMPTFLLGLLLLYYLYFQLTLAGIRIFPAGGYVNFTTSPLGWLQHMILPWITVALVSAAAYTRLTRTSMLEVLGEDYIRTARSKGISERRVVVRHGLRSALSPVVTQFGIDVATLLGGVIITETVFSNDGIGRTAIVAIDQQDQPVIIGIVLLGTVAVVVANVLVDIGYAVLDPRVRLT